MLANGPALGNLYTNPLKPQGPLVLIWAHLDTSFPIQKIIWLSLFDET